MLDKLKYLFLAIAFLSHSCLPLKAAPWEEIETRGKLIVGIKDNLRPLGFRDGQGNLQGLEIDIARRLAAELFADGDAIVFVPLSNQNRLQAVIDDRVDLAIASITANSYRRRLVEFSPSYYLNATGIITNKPHWEEVPPPAKVAVLYNSDAIAEVRHNLPGVELMGVNSYGEALSLLEEGQADAFAADVTVLSGWVREYPEYRLLKPNYAAHPLAIAMPKGRQYQQLRQKIIAIVRQLRQQGWLEQRAKFWGLPLINEGDLSNSRDDL